MKPFACFLIAFLFSFHQLFAVEYYVDSKNGKDNNNGTSIQKPLQSLQAVNALRLLPGDKVLFRRGTFYYGQLRISCEGNPGNIILISSYGKGDMPVINGGGMYEEGVIVYNSEQLTIENIEVTNKGKERKPGRKGVHILLSDYGIAHNIRINNLYIHDVNGSNIKKQGGGAGIHWTNKGSKIKSAFDSLLIEHCRIERTDRNGIISSGYWSRKDWFPSLHVIIRYNYLNDIGGDGIVPMGCDGALIEHNTLYRAGQRFPEGDAAAGIWPWSCDNTIIQYNEVACTSGPWDSQGFDSDWNCDNTIIQYNYSHDNIGGFLLVCNDGSVGYPNSIGNIGTIVRYNLSINDGGRTTGIHAEFSPSIHITGPVYNTKVYNNVVYIMQRKSKKTDSTLIEMGNWNGYADSTLIANNIFYVEETADYQMAKSTRNFYQSNLYYGRHINKPQTTGEIISNPGFKSLPPKGLNGFDKLKCFMLQKNSLCRQAGEPIVDSAIKDFFGNTVWPGLRPAIGVHQLE